MYPLKPDTNVVEARWVISNKVDILKLIEIFNKNNYNNNYNHNNYIKIIING